VGLFDLPSSTDLISQEFSSLFAGISTADASHSSTDDINGVLASASGSGNVQNAPSNSGVGSPQSQPSGGTSFLSEAAGLAEGLLGPIPSIISDITSLFGGGGTKSAPVFAPYELPASIAFQGAVNSSGGLDASDTNQYGDPRDLVAAAAPLAGGSADETVGAPAAAPTAAPAGGGSASSGTSGHTFNQTFNMQAFDGASMAGMSDQIAASVRQSLLTSNALSDVITNDLN
jgi:hypothetical protein